MLIRQLHLQNYRVFENALTLDLPGGLVGIFGANGSGKSSLIESIRWTLYGKTRTDLKDIRTADVNADCITEVQFEHEGHLYLVRRTISGAGKTPVVRALAHCDGAQVAEGALDTRRYLHSVLGMDDAAFRASVFAEQKQLTAFSSETPEKRKKLVMQLLGITPLTNARDLARADSRARAQEYERVRTVLPDLAILRVEAEDAAARAAAAATESTDAAAIAERAAATEAAAEENVQALAALEVDYERLLADGRTARAELNSVTERAAALEAELAKLAEAADRLASLDHDDARLEAAERDASLIEAVLQAQRELEAAPEPVEPAPLDEDAVTAATAAHNTAAARVAELAGEAKGVRAQWTKADADLRKAETLAGGADCPTCGQALGEHFAAAQAHRAAEVAALAGQLAALEADHAAAVAAAAGAKTAASAEAAALKERRTEWERFATARDRHRQALERLDAAIAARGGPVDTETAGAVQAEVLRLRTAAREAARLRGQLERRPTVEAELRTARDNIGQAQGQVETLLQKVKSLGFDPAALAAARDAHAAARTAAASARTRAEQARLDATTAQNRAEAAARRVTEGERQHAEVAGLAEESRYLGRLSDLLAAFRNTVVATVGPRLAARNARPQPLLPSRRLD